MSDKTERLLEVAFGLKQAAKWLVEADRARHAQSESNALFYAQEDIAKALRDVIKARAALTPLRAPDENEEEVVF